MQFSTKLIHAAQASDPATGAVSPPLYQTSTFQQDAPGCDRGFDYTRSGNPNRAQLEAVLADLEGVPHAALFASGLAAEHAVLQAHLSPGDEVVIPMDVYGGTYRLLHQVFVPQGSRVTQLDFRDPVELSERIPERVKLVWLETPTNPRLQIYDIEAVAEIAQRSGALLVVDNTFATPCLQQPFALGADIVVHSVTKYLAGHLDVLMGAALARRDDVVAPIRFLQNAIGAVPGPFDCWLALRGLRTLELRVTRQCATAQTVAEALRGHPVVASVYYPGLDSHPAHDVAVRQMNGFGGIVSFELRGSPDERAAFVSSRRHFVLAESLGGVKSLICHPATMTHASVPAAERRRMTLSDQLVRLSIGCEDALDLVGDLEEGLAALTTTERPEVSVPE